MLVRSRVGTVSRCLFPRPSVARTAADEPPRTGSRRVSERDGERIVHHRGARSRAPQAEARSRSRSRSEEHKSELQSLMRISYAVFTMNKNKIRRITHNEIATTVK